MSRRRSRLHSELAALAGELDSLSLEAPAEVEGALARARRTLRDFLLPRLASARPPLVVAFVGSTGAGKSTLLNSLAGAVISPAGVLRPTTRVSRYWASEEFAPAVASLGNVVFGCHPLLKNLVLVDTPDLDSDLPEHRIEALTVADQADVILFVTTAGRYGDDTVWRAITELAKAKPIGVILNRTPSRAAGVRNDLQARLRRAGLGEVEMFTISEQRIDPGRLRLPSQAVQRVSGYLRRLSFTPAALEFAAERAAADVEAALEWLDKSNEKRRQANGVIKSEIDRLEAELSAMTTAPRRLWRRQRTALPERARHVADLEHLRSSMAPEIPTDKIRGGWQVLLDADFDRLWDE
ncbi:hypothetical protein BH18ACT5_BH18ACT5_00090 [soil metagenome]